MEEEKQMAFTGQMICPHTIVSLCLSIYVPIISPKLSDFDKTSMIDVEWILLSHFNFGFVSTTFKGHIT
jgi:hypothetical protein